MLRHLVNEAGSSRVKHLDVCQGKNAELVLHAGTLRAGIGATSIVVEGRSMTENAHAICNSHQESHFHIDVSRAVVMGSRRLPNLWMWIEPWKWKAPEAKSNSYMYGCALTAPVRGTRVPNELQKASPPYMYMYTGLRLLRSERIP